MLRVNGWLVAAAIASFGAFPAASSAAPILGGTVIVQGTGDVIATYLGATASLTSHLYLDSPSNGLGLIFSNGSNSVGDTFNLGSFAVGTELVFRIDVIGTGNSFFTGPASRNPDGLFHAVVDDAYSPTETFVGFEDLLGGGDRDYDDLKFSFTNVRSGDPTVPEPTTGIVWLLFAASGAGVRRWQSKRRG